MGLEEKYIEKLNNPNKKIRFEALKGIVKNKNIGFDTVSILKKFVLVEKDPEILYFARKSLDKLSSKIKPRISPVDISDHEFVQALYGNDTNAKIDVLKKVISLNKKKYINYLVDRLSTEKDEFVIATLVKAVAYLGEKKHLDNIIPFLKHEDARVRANTVEAIAILDNKNTTHLILPMLKDEHPRVKITAVNFLLNYVEPEKIEEIIKNMAKSSKIADKSAVLFLIEKTKSPKYSNILLELSRDKSKTIANKAKEVLEKINNFYEEPDEFEMLKKIAKKKESEEVDLKPAEKKEKVVKDAYNLLVDELLNATDEETIRKAVIKLGKLGDVRAIKVLEAYETDSKVINYFKEKALNKLKILHDKIIVCPNCGFQIRKEDV